MRELSIAELGGIARQAWRDIYIRIPPNRHHDTDSSLSKVDFRWVLVTRELKKMMHY